MRGFTGKYMEAFVFLADRCLSIVSIDLVFILFYQTSAQVKWTGSQCESGQMYISRFFTSRGKRCVETVYLWVDCIVNQIQSRSSFSNFRIFFFLQCEAISCKTKCMKTVYLEVCLSKIVDREDSGLCPWQLTVQPMDHREDHLEGSNDSRNRQHEEWHTQPNEPDPWRFTKQWSNSLIMCVHQRWSCRPVWTLVHPWLHNKSVSHHDF